MPFLMGAPLFPAGNPALSLVGLGLGWRIPKTGIAFDGVSWTCVDPSSVAVTMGGTPGLSYDVKIRLLGVIEFANYGGGLTFPDATHAPHFSTGGGYAGLGWNEYRLTVSSALGSPVVWHCNTDIVGGSGSSCEVVDETVTIIVDAGATVTALARTIDSVEAHHTLSNPAVTSPAQPYLGQFLNILPLGATVH